MVVVNYLSIQIWERNCLSIPKLFNWNCLLSLIPLLEFLPGFPFGHWRAVWAWDKEWCWNGCPRFFHPCTDIWLHTGIYTERHKTGMDPYIERQGGGFIGHRCCVVLSFYRKYNTHNNLIKGSEAAKLSNN